MFINFKTEKRKQKFIKWEMLKPYELQVVFIELTLLYITQRYKTISYSDLVIANANIKIVN